MPQKALDKNAIRFTSCGCEAIMSARCPYPAHPIFDGKLKIMDPPDCFEHSLELCTAAMNDAKKSGNPSAVQRAFKTFKSRWDGATRPSQEIGTFAHERREELSLTLDISNGAINIAKRWQQTRRKGSC